jgi:hypothetical protein
VLASGAGPAQHPGIVSLTVRWAGRRSTEGISDKQGIVVHGMGRSGTSAVAGMFVRAGFFAGRESDLLGPTDFNARGHHENSSLVLANERVLRQAGGTWFEGPEAGELQRIRDQVTPVLRQALDRIVGESNGRAIAVKDPRIDVLMSIWGPILNPRLHPVLVTRNPAEIALSLQRRDATAPPSALAAWELHMAELLAHLNGRLVTVVPYGRLTQEPELAEQIVAIAATHIDRPRASHINSADAPLEIDAQLRHHAVTEFDERALLTLHQRELWRVLASLPLGDQTLSMPRHATVPSAHAREIAHAETKRVWDAAQQAKTFEALEEERVRNATLAADLHDARLHGEEATVAFRQASAMLAAMRNSKSWRITTPFRAAKQGISNGRR